MIPKRQVRAAYTDNTITVYQAYGAAIGVPAAEHGIFPSAFKRDRMTWIKPSFLWMMYRCGWATKPQQEHVLAIQLHRDGFEWALRNSACSSYDRNIHSDRNAWQQTLRHNRNVRIQWDPERDIRLQPLPYRSLQIGLSGEAVDRYLDEWIVDISDVTKTAHTVHDAVNAGEIQQARGMLPVEMPYPIPEDIISVIGAGADTTG